MMVDIRDGGAPRVWSRAQGHYAVGAPPSHCGFRQLGANESGCTGDQDPHKRVISFRRSSSVINRGTTSIPRSQMRPGGSGFTGRSSLGNFPYKAMSLKIPGRLRPASVKKRTVVKKREM